MEIRKATMEDVADAAAILRQAALRMVREGKCQWDDTYPTSEHVRADVERGVGYVLEADGKVVGYCAIVFDGEPAYEHIQGEWLSELPYVVVHRIAVSDERRGEGLGKRFMLLIEDYARSRGVESFKVDTNFDNFSMLGLLEHLGFAYCGEVFYERGSRKAFEKLI